LGHVIGGVRGIYDCFEFEAEKLGLTSGQIQGSWSMRWWDAGGGVPAPQLPLCVDAFRAWRVNAGTKTGFMAMYMGGRLSDEKEWGGLSAFACFKGFGNLIGERFLLCKENTSND